MYRRLILPRIDDKVPRKTEIIALKELHPSLRNLSYWKLKNKLNADVQRIRRQESKI